MAYTQVDDCDFDWLNQWRWGIQFSVPRKDGTRASHVRRGGPDRGKLAASIYMHKEILQRKLGRPLEQREITDHRDRDGLNNQRDNLRPTSHSGNRQNCAKLPGVTSQFIGVHLEEGRWVTHIRVRKKGIYVGTYRDEVSAAIAYDAAAREHFGPLANVNFRHLPERGTDARQYPML